MNAISKQMDLFGELPKQKKIKAAGGALAVGGEQGEVMSIGELTDAYNMYRGNADSGKLTSDEMDAILDIFLEDMPSAGKSYAKGGMENGGLKDEGGEIDPVSGNDVPPGSTKEEVRDDIPAQLSEGEFVFPADVVRYIGLENLMRIRQEAKQGLKMMEAMGQMGNSEEATIPDDLPFAITDLIIVDTEDDKEYNKEEDEETKNFQVGGMATGTSTTTQPGVYFTPSTYPIQQPTQAASFQYQVPSVYKAPTQSITPIQTGAVPQIGDFMQQAQSESASKIVDIINPDTGQEQQITYIPGVTQLPEGFILKSEYQPEEKVTSQTATTQTTGVDTSRVSDSDDGPTPDDGFGPGGGRIAIGGEVYSGPTTLQGGNIKTKLRPGEVQGATQFGVSFKSTRQDKGLLGLPVPSMGKVAQTVAQASKLAIGKPLGDDMIATITRNNVSIDLPASIYNQLKENNFRGELANKVLADFDRREKLGPAEDALAKATSEYEAAKTAGDKNRAAQKKAVAALAKFGITETTGQGKLEELNKKLNEAIQAQAAANAKARQEGTGSVYYDEDSGSSRNDYSFNEYSSNVAAGTETRSYGAAYDSDVLGLDE